jgi:hypothetical protein
MSDGKALLILMQPPSKLSCEISWGDKKLYIPWTKSGNHQKC